jgi:hypothetical protein
MRSENLACMLLLVARVENKHSTTAFNFPLDIYEARSQQFAKSSCGILSAAEGSQEGGAGAEATNAVSRRTLVLHNVSIAGLREWCRSRNFGVQPSGDGA